jgi:hypothetical protein
VTNEISAAESVRGHGAEAGGEPTPLRDCCGAAARHPIAAHAADPSPAVPGRTTRSNVIGCPSSVQTRGAVSDGGAALFDWGSLNSYEDEILWRMRAQGRPWPRIAARIEELRAIARDNGTRTGNRNALRAYRRARVAAAVRKMMEAR